MLINGSLWKKSEASNEVSQGLILAIFFFNIFNNDLDEVEEGLIVFVSNTKMDQIANILGDRNKNKRR